MTKKPIISIITVSFNVVNEIEQTILSVINQTYSNIEYIIIDGGSTDGTIDIIKKYSNHISYWISEPDKGIYDAMNKGIEKASGSYINFMNAGDYFYSNNIIAEIAKVNLKNDIIFGDTVICRNGQMQISKADPFYKYKRLRHKMGFVHQSVFVKTCLAKQNLFDLNYKLAADYNMIITLYRKGAIFYYIDLPIAYYDLNGVSSKNRLKHIYETLCVDNQKFSITNKIMAYFILLKWNISIYVKKTIKFK